MPPRHPYAPRQLPSGAVVQAAVYDGDGQQSHATGVIEAVVLAVYYTDDPMWRPRGLPGVPVMVADVRTIGRQSRTLRKVPCAQRTLGLDDEDTYELRPAQQNLQGGELSTTNSPTPAKDTDADTVLVMFREGNPAWPIVLPFTLGHLSTHRPMAANQARRRMRFQGTSVEWDRDGNLTIDASDAHAYQYGPKGQPVSTSGVGGEVTVKTKDGAGAQSQMKLEKNGNAKLHGGGATEGVFCDKASHKTSVKAAATAEAVAPEVDLLATGATVQCGDGQIIGTAASMVAMTGPGIPAFPVVQHEPWKEIWYLLQQDLTVQMNIYNPPPGIPAPPVVSVADYLRLITTLQNLAGLFPVLGTKIFKGG